MRPRDERHGDLSSNVALLLAKQEHKPPLELAGSIQKHLDLDPQLITEISVAPPGFLNFKVNESYYHAILAEILTEKGRFFQGTQGRNQMANVEFVSANPTGPLTVGHGRQAVLGDTVANILEWHGYQVTREYYYNDAGRQMRLLGQSVAARYLQLLGKEVPFPKDGYQGAYIRDLAQIVRDRYGDELEPEDPRFLKVAEQEIFAQIRDTLKRLGIVHDLFTNEKTFYESGTIDEVLDQLGAQGLVYEAEGATWLKATALGLEQDRVLKKSTGEPTYRLPDIAYHCDKFKRGYDLIVDLFGADHAVTYPDVLAAVKVLGHDPSRVRVLIHQFVTLVRGGEKIKMSTRKGEFVTLNDLIEELGPDVVRYFFLLRGMNSHLNFDLELARDQSEKNPVFYLQYAHARICNIIKRGEQAGVTFQQHFQSHILTHPQEMALLKTLSLFPDTMEHALETLEPQVIVQYLQELATRFHKFYTECPVVKADRERAQARLALVEATRMLLANGLKILGINAPERM
jgi:arginyl-tRNA synthetase